MLYTPPISCAALRCDPISPSSRIARASEDSELGTPHQKKLGAGCDDEHSTTRLVP